MRCHSLYRRIIQCKLVNSIKGVKGHPISSNFSAKLTKSFKGSFAAFNGKKIPTVKELNAEFQECLTQKREAYTEYHDAKDKMQLYKIAKYDIDRILQDDMERDNARSSHREHGQVR